MDWIKKAAEAFKELMSVEYSIVLSSGRHKPTETIDINFCDTDLFHILGLQYLTDIDLPKNKKNLLNEISKDSVSDAYISKSEFYDNDERLGFSIRQRIEKAVNLEGYLDSDNFIVSVYQAQHDNRTKIKADYLLTCKGIQSGNEYYIFIRKRKCEDGYGIVSCFPKGSVTYWGGKRYLMLRKKSKNGVDSVLFRHPNYT